MTGRMWATRRLFVRAEPADIGQHNHQSSNSKKDEKLFLI